MTVYVDTMRAPYGRMILCHMVADTPAELHAMADRIGMRRSWVQDSGYRLHYDIPLGRRAKALRFGARSISRRELGRLLRQWRAAERQAAARLAAHAAPVSAPPAAAVPPSTAPPAEASAVPATAARAEAP